MTTYELVLAMGFTASAAVYLLGIIVVSVFNLHMAGPALLAIACAGVSCLAYQTQMFDRDWLGFWLVILSVLIGVGAGLTTLHGAMGKAKP